MLDGGVGCFALEMSIMNTKIYLFVIKAVVV
jgi:hypothetical protein